MKKPIISLLIIITFSLSSFAQTKQINDDENGDWSEQYVTLYDTPEADIMVRAGDIDNLSFGWPNDFNPFSGNTTPTHGFPWALDSLDASGTDRIMVVTSYNGSPPYGTDGYTNTTSRPENLPRPILLSYDLNGVELQSAILQMFVDDFQASRFGAHYFANINGVDAPFISNIINLLDQSGPVGKIININIPENFLFLLERDSLSIFLDDTISGAGDGHAIDFVKLLMNPKDFTYTAQVYGYVTDAATGNPIENAIIAASGTTEVVSNQDGYYIFEELPAGISDLMATKFSYDTTTILVDLVSDDSIRKDFQINEVLEADFIADATISNEAPHTVSFTDLTSMNPTVWAWDFGDGSTSDEQNPIHTYNDNGRYTVTLIANNDTETNTKVKVNYIQIGLSGIEDYSLFSNLIIAPNPIRSSGYFSFKLLNSCNLNIEMMDFTGRTIRNISKHYFYQGEHSIKIETEDLTDGIYFICIKSGSSIITQKVLILHE